jgi:hypothetical protein
MFINKKCYRFAKKEFQEGGLLDNCVDATYIIHLESDTERMDQVIQQLDIFHPTKIVYIVYNKGFSACEKGLHENTPPIDLVDAFLTVFKDAREKGYNNILVLEDDFIFDDSIRDPIIRENIFDFLQKHCNESFIYVLGCLPMIQLPYSYKHRIALCKAGTHAVIYPPLFREEVLSIDQTTIIDWDVYTNVYCRQYMYNQPLCYQLFPATDNQKHWFHVPGFSEMFAYSRSTLQLDKSVEPGYSFFYGFISHIVLVLVFLLLIISFRVHLLLSIIS